MKRKICVSFQWFLVANLRNWNDHGYVPFVVITIRSFPHMWLITGVYYKSNTTGVKCGAGPAYTSGTHSVVSGVRVARSSVCCVLFCRSLFVLFVLAIVLSVLLHFTASDNPFGIFKLVLDIFANSISRTRLDIFNC
jgi:hypothetical protein